MPYHKSNKKTFPISNKEQTINISKLPRNYFKVISKCTMIISSSDPGQDCWQRVSAARPPLSGAEEAPDEDGRGHGSPDANTRQEGVDAMGVGKSRVGVEEGAYMTVYLTVYMTGYMTVYMIVYTSYTADASEKHRLCTEVAAIALPEADISYYYYHYYYYNYKQ